MYQPTSHSPVQTAAAAAEKHKFIYVSSEGIETSEAWK
jgi:hypothetical protein